MKRTVLQNVEAPEGIVASAGAPDQAGIASHMKAKWALPEPSVIEDFQDTPAKPSDKPPENTQEAPKATENAPEAKVEEPKWPRNAKEWDAYKTAEKQRTAEAQKMADQYKADLESTRKEIEALKNSGPSPELDALKKERDEIKKGYDDALERIRIIDVEKDPRFQRYFNGKTEQQLGLAASIVGAEHAESAKKILSMPDGEYRNAKIDELMQVLTPTQSSRFAGVLNNMEIIRQERESALSEVKANYETIQAKTKAEQEASMNQFKSEATNKFNFELSEAQKESMFFQTKEGDEEWNKGVQLRIETAKALMFEKKPLEQVSKAALYASAFPEALRQVQSLTSENKKLTEQVSKLTAASPKLGETKPSDASTETGTRPVLKSGMRPSDVSAEWMKQSQSNWK